MQSLKRTGRSARSRQQPVTEPAPEGVERADAEFESDEAVDTYRVICPDCGQSIALLADEEELPEHALCPSPWNPFGLQVCAGTGRSARDAWSAGASADDRGQGAVLLSALPQGLDWRTQPFSHVGGPGSRPMRVQQTRRPAA